MSDWIDELTQDEADRHAHRQWLAGLREPSAAPVVAMFHAPPKCDGCRRHGAPLRRRRWGPRRRHSAGLEAIGRSEAGCLDPVPRPQRVLFSVSPIRAGEAQIRRSF